MPTEQQRLDPALQLALLCKNMCLLLRVHADDGNTARSQQQDQG